MTTKTEARPEYVTEEMLIFLDDLRESGRTNMFGAGPYIQHKFEMTRKEAREVLAYWMRTFSERHAR